MAFETTNGTWGGDSAGLWMPLVEPCTEPDGWTRYYNDTSPAFSYYGYYNYYDYTYDYALDLPGKCAPDCNNPWVCDEHCLTSWCNWSEGSCSSSGSYYSYSDDSDEDYGPVRERGMHDQLVMLWAQNRNTCVQLRRDEDLYDSESFNNYHQAGGGPPENVTVETYRKCNAPCCEGMQVVDARCRVKGTGVPVEQLPFGHLITCSPVGLQCWDEDIAAWAAENGGSTQACPSLEISWRCAPPPPPLPPFPPPFPPPGN